MPPSPSYRPEPAYADLNAENGGAFADPVAPADFPQRILRYRNARWAGTVGLEGVDGAEWEAAFARFEALPGNMPEPLAMRYHGHQFQSYNPDIGDGRGFLFAQLRDRGDRLLDLATKGSGKTPYSRLGDGRLTLKGGVREVLAANMLEALGVYTSKPFALFETGEQLARNDEPSPTRSSVLTRLGHSHIRFGTFQRLAAKREPELMEKLVAHCAAVYYPDLLALSGAERVAKFYDHAVAASARLAATWMAAGFVHGVLNSDNMTITGESFDYGPWRFLPTSDPDFTAAYFDETGLYAFSRQPGAVAWNLAQLGGALAVIVEDEAPLNAALARFPIRYGDALRAAMFARLGLKTGDTQADLNLLEMLLTWMTESQIGWAQFFHDQFCGRAGGSDPRYNDASFDPLREALAARIPERPERLKHPLLTRAAPVDLLIEELEAIWAAIADGDDWGPFEAKLAEIEEYRAALGLTPTNGFVAG
jgi:serine/tyrosine/threonine adenylyltransferase